MNKAVLTGIIVGIIIVGLAMGYSLGVENQDKIDVDQEVGDVPQPRNITIELSDGITFSEGP